MQAHETLSILLDLKNQIVTESKRVLKTKVPKNAEILENITENLIALYNQFIDTAKIAAHVLNDSEKQKARKLFNRVRDRTVRSFQVLKIKYKVPISSTEKIQKDVIDSDFEEEEEEENDCWETNKVQNSFEQTETSTMATTSLEFFNMAGKIITTEYEGSPDKLISFIDSLNLLKANCTGHEANAVAFVKTKLTGKARDLINNDDNLEEIIFKLKAGIKGESSQSVSAKIVALKQQNKDKVRYASEIEELANKLKRAYVSEGVPAEVAETYTTNITVKAICTNATSEKCRTIMEAGNFLKTQDAITKFVNITTDEVNKNIFFMNRGRQSYGTLQNYRGNNGRGRNNTYRYSSNNNGSYNNHRKYEHGSHNQRQISNHRRNYRNVNNRGNQNSRFIRHITYGDLNQGNDEFPQPGPLGNQ